MRSVNLALILFAVAMLCAGSLLASGFENSGVGTTARGMGGAFRAVADDWTAAYYNPAGYAFISRDQFGGETKFIHNRHELTPNYAMYDNYGNEYGWGIVNHQEVYNFHRVTDVFSGGVVFRLPDIDEKTVFGVSAYQPFDHTLNWRLYNTDAAGLSAYNLDAGSLNWGDQYSFDIDVVAFQVTAARPLIEDKLSVGLGLQLLKAELDYTDLVFRENPREAPFNDRPRDRVAELVRNNASGWGFGFRVGFMYKLNEKLNLGASAFVPFEITIDGETDFRYILPEAATLLDYVNNAPEDNLFVSGEAVDLHAQNETKLKLPASLSFGLSYQVTEKLLVALDAEYTLWSSYEGLAFVYSDFTGLPFYTSLQGDRFVMEEDFFTSDLASPVEWKDAGKIALGLRYDATSYLTLMAGGSADQSPAREANALTPQIVDTGDKYGYNFGATFHIAQWDVGVVTTYIDYPDLTIHSLKDINGDSMYDAFPGDYKASTYETVLSIGYRF